MIFKTCFLVAFLNAIWYFDVVSFLQHHLIFVELYYAGLILYSEIKKWELIINIYNALFSDIGLEIYRKLGKVQCIPWNLRSEFQARLLIINYNL